MNGLTEQQVRDIVREEIAIFEMRVRTAVSATLRSQANAVIGRRSLGAEDEVRLRTAEIKALGAPWLKPEGKR